jgi:predicted lactoylglutathione lyase
MYYEFRILLVKQHYMKQIQLAAQSAEILMCLTQRSLESYVLSELVRKAISTDAQKASRPSVYFSVY